MINNKLLLNSKNSLPFQPAQLIFHNPTIAEISLIGQLKFWQTCQYLTFSKNFLSDEDKNRLKDKSDFDILMMMMKTDSIAKIIKENFLSMFNLLCPEYKINFLPLGIMFFKKTEDNFEQHIIDNSNFDKFKEFISETFCLNQFLAKGVHYNPGGPQATALVKKFEKRQQILNKLKNRGGDGEDLSILNTYISILAVGLGKDKNNLMQYTVYQLFDEFNRFRAKVEFDLYVQAKMAGAEGINEVENWMSDKRSDS